MYPLARVMIRRHFVDRFPDKDGDYGAHDLRLFRVVGGPTSGALRCLEREIQVGGRCCVGVTTEGASGLSDASIKVLRAVSEFCQVQGLPLFLCGVDESTLAQLLPEDSPMRSSRMVFHTLQDLIAIFCESGCRGQAGGAHRK